MDEDQEERQEEQQNTDSLTDSEEREVESGRMDAEEAHRYGEFEELRSMLRNVEEKMDSILDGMKAIREGMGVFVENGAVIADIEENSLPGSIAESVDETMFVPLEDLDLTIDKD